MTPEIMADYPFDHAGEGETSLMLALCPEVVDMKRRSKKQWYTRSAAKASRETGERGRDLILAHMRKVLVSSEFDILSSGCLGLAFRTSNSKAPLESVIGSPVVLLIPTFAQAGSSREANVGIGPLAG